MSVLKALHLKKTYKKRTVVSDVSLSVSSGSVVGLLGPNGAGKTTSFYMIVGIISSEEGQVILDDHDLTSLPMHARARAGLGYLPQENSIFRKLTVYQNLMGVVELLPGLTKSEKEDRVFYACFLEESVYDKPDTDLFEFTYNDSLTFSEYPELEGKYYAGYEASPAMGKTLTGKVTLPATYNGKPVIMIRNMHKTKITHFFLEGEDHPLVAVGQGSSAVSDRWTTL